MSVYPGGVAVRREAVISDCGLYRYRLTRMWDIADPLLSFIMLNPSTADAESDDPTIRRCVGFARWFGYGGIAVYNLYAFRATKPTEVWKAAKAGVDVVGPENDDYLRRVLLYQHDAQMPVVAAWGANVKDDRAQWLLSQPGAIALHHLGLTKHGVPRHPLFVKVDALLTPLF